MTEETDDEQRIAQAAVGGWMHAIVGWQEAQDDAIKILTEQVEKLAHQVTIFQQVILNATES